MLNQPARRNKPSAEQLPRENPAPHHPQHLPSLVDRTSTHLEEGDGLTLSAAEE